MDQVSAIMAYEDGSLSANETVDLFADLVKTGLAWKLQGAYGRMATSLINSGFIDRTGKVVAYPSDKD